MKPVRLLIAEDQATVLGALAALLEMQGGFEIVAQVTDGCEAVKVIQNQPLDLVLSDIEMPNMTGLELAEWIKQRDRLVPRMVILTTFARPAYLSRARAAGVAGYLLKEAPSDELARNLRKIMRGHTVIDPVLAELEDVDTGPLNERERRILRLAESGLSSAAIAGQVHRTEGTVRNILSDIIKRLGARNRTEATRLARSRGWL